MSTKHQFHGLPSPSITAAFYISPSRSRAGGRAWGHVRLTCLHTPKWLPSLSFALVSDPNHYFKSQKTHQSAFWLSVAKTSMQPKTSPWVGALSTLPESISVDSESSSPGAPKHQSGCGCCCCCCCRRRLNKSSESYTGRGETRALSNKLTSYFSFLF